MATHDSLKSPAVPGKAQEHPKSVGSGSIYSLLEVTAYEKSVSGMAAYEKSVSGMAAHEMIKGACKSFRWLESK